MKRKTKRNMAILATAVPALMPLGQVAVAGNGPPPFLDQNHYECYKVKGESVKVPAQLQDQFGLSDAVVVKPELLCNPVQKTDANGTFPIQNDLLHYTCYKIKVTPSNVPRTVGVTNQFGVLQPLEVIKAKLLCAPSLKE